MKISFNAMLLSAPSFGIRSYIYNLLKNFFDLDKVNEYLIYSGSDDFDSKDNFKIIRPFKNKISASRRILWEHFVLPKLLNNGKTDLFHMPDHILPVLSVKAKKVITIHDLSFYIYPETFNFSKRFYKKLLTPYSVKNADFIIADSNSTKSDIIKLFSYQEQKIKVVYIGVSEMFKKINDQNLLKKIRSKRRLPKNFIIFVGTLEKRKNIELLIDSFADLIRQKKIDHDLIIVGKKGWLFEGIFEKINKKELAGRVKFIFDTTDDELPILYNLADLMVYPSLYEGFGLPVVESMACGCPVITSNVSSLKEIACGAAILINPRDKEELSYYIEKVLTDENLRNDLITKGFQRAKNFTWRKCAEETLQIYNSIL